MISTLFSFLVGSGWMPVDPLPALDWQLVSDRTERGGESTGRVTDVPNGIEFFGSLGSIPGNDGEPVGFSLARIPVRIPSRAKGLRVRLESANEIVMQILIAPPLEQPAVTFQREVALVPGVSELKIPWSEFRAVSRGRPVPGELNPKTVTSVALQVTRSAQPGGRRYEPIEFGIRLLGEAKD